MTDPRFSFSIAATRLVVDHPGYEASITRGGRRIAEGVATFLDLMERGELDRMRPHESSDRFRQLWLNETTGGHLVQAATWALAGFDPLNATEWSQNAIAGGIPPDSVRAILVMFGFTEVASRLLPLEETHDA